MYISIQALLVLLLLSSFIWLLLRSKSSRSDGILVKNVHPYRKAMIQLMPTVSMSQASLSYKLDIQPSLDFIDKHKGERDITLSHIAIAAINHALQQNSEIDRFISGGRMYQRKNRSISFSVKKTKMDQKAALGTVKIDLRDDENFFDLCDRINDKITQERSIKPTSLDMEYKLLSKLPTPVLSALIRLGYLLNTLNLLPSVLVKNDMMHTSALLANFGTLGMPAANHHLYDWGTCPIFIAIGDVTDEIYECEGQYKTKKSLDVIFNFDERISDGLTAWNAILSGLKTLEQPEKYYL